MVLKRIFTKPTFLPSALNKMPNTITERHTDLPRVSRLFLTLEPRSRGISDVFLMVFSCNHTHTHICNHTLTSQSHTHICNHTLTSAITLTSAVTHSHLQSHTHICNHTLTSAITHTRLQSHTQVYNHTHVCNHTLTSAITHTRLQSHTLISAITHTHICNHTLTSQSHENNPDVTFVPT